MRNWKCVDNNLLIVHNFKHISCEMFNSIYCQVKSNFSDIAINNYRVEHAFDKIEKIAKVDD